MISPDIHIKFSAGLLRAIDEAAAASHQSRSQFIRESIVLRLNEQHIVAHRPKTIDWPAIMAEDGV